MELIHPSYKKQWNSQLSMVFASASRVFSFGVFLSAISVWLFFYWHAPHFSYQLNITEQDIVLAYHRLIWSDVGILLISGLYTIFSTMRFGLRWNLGEFALTSFFLGLCVPIIAAQPWYHSITHGSLPLDHFFLVIFMSLFSDIIIQIIMRDEDEKTSEVSRFLIVFFVAFISLFFLSGLCFHSTTDKALSTSYQRAMHMQKTP